jgi:hypothetical protein
MTEQTCERIDGIREDLPPGEHILWQGKPTFSSLARRAFHVRQVALYFSVIAACTGLSAWYDGQSMMAVLLPVALGTVACLMLSCMAWMSSRTSIYAITTGRVFLRVGMALPLDVNLPLRRIESAGLALHKDGSGDITVTLESRAKVAYLHLWPHARPWRLKRPEPMLRSLAGADAVADILSRALQAAHTAANEDLRVPGSADAEARPANAGVPIPFAPGDRGPAPSQSMGAAA